MSHGSVTEEKAFLNESLEAHYHRFFGKHCSTSVDLSPGNPVDLLIFPPTPERPIYTIATRGLSNFSQKTPAGQGNFQHQEMIIYLPGDWKVDLDEPGSPSVWAAAFLKYTARYIIDKNVFMRPGSVCHTETSRHPAFFQYPYAVFVPPLIEKPEFFPLKTEGKTIEFSVLLLITEKEADFMKANGFRALIDEMCKRDTFDPIMQSMRRCTFEAPGTEQKIKQLEQLESFVRAASDREQGKIGTNKSPTPTSEQHKSVAKTPPATAPAPEKSKSAAKPPAAPTPEHRAIGTKAAMADDVGLADRIFLAIENPVLRRELLTALRSNKAFILQGLFLLALGTVVYVAWPKEITTTSSDMARQLFKTFGQGELVLLSILAPAFSASAMTIEKERRCLDLLLTSPINPNTILIGKYMSSVLYLFLLVLSTAPLVSVILWLPGLGPAEVAGLYLLLLSVAACFGMIGLTCSTFFHRSQASLSITYMVVLPLALILLGFAVGFDGFFLLETAAWPSAILLLAAFFMYRACQARLRQPFDPVFKAAEEEDVSTQTGLVLVRDRFPDNLLAPPRDDELLPDGVNPIYQKEIRSEIFGRGTLFLRLIIQISMFLSVVFLTFLYLGKEHIFVYYLILFSMLVAPAFACNTITQERERGTLDLLLTTLVKPRQIITGKFISCLRLSLFLTALVGVTMCFYLFVGAREDSVVQRAAYLFVYLSIIVTTIIFETALAMFFSLNFRSTIQSMITTYTILLFLFALPVAADILMSTYIKMDTGLLRQQMYFYLIWSPFEAVYSVTSKNIGQSESHTSYVMLWPAFLTAYLTLSALLMGYVYSRFESKCLENTKPQ